MRRAAVEDSLATAWLSTVVPSPCAGQRLAEDRELRCRRRRPRSLARLELVDGLATSASASPVFASVQAGRRPRGPRRSVWSRAWSTFCRSNQTLWLALRCDGRGELALSRLEYGGRHARRVLGRMSGGRSSAPVFGQRHGDGLEPEALGDFGERLERGAQFFDLVEDVGVLVSGLGRRESLGDVGLGFFEADLTAGFDGRDGDSALRTDARDDREVVQRQPESRIGEGAIGDLRPGSGPEIRAVVPVAARYRRTGCR